ncbi:MAG: TIGR02710 family CRISPR-associated CARF protein [candidate division WOR-3 bacterium]
MKKKAFIATIGTGKGVEDGINFSIKEQNPSHIYLIVTKDSIKTAENLKKIVGEHDENIEFDLMNIEDENDVEAIFKEISTLVLNILKEGFSKNQIIADYTSGTKAMSAALVLAAVEHQIDRLSYVHGTRNPETGRVESGSERVKSLSPKIVFEKKIIEQTAFLHNNYQFKAAINIIDNHSFSKKIKPYADIIKQLAEAHDSWDKFRFNDAKDKFSKIDPKISKSIKIQKALLNINAWLNRINKDCGPKLESDCQLLQTDLFYNAQRRGEEGKYDDGVARLYRLLEMIIQSEYIKIHKVNSGRPLQETWEVIKNIESRIIKALNQREDEIKKIQSARNNSILAHGKNPISKETYEKFKEIVYEILIPSESVEFVKININNLNEVIISS